MTLLPVDTMTSHQYEHPSLSMMERDPLFRGRSFKIIRVTSSSYRLCFKIEPVIVF